MNGDPENHGHPAKQADRESERTQTSNEIQQENEKHHEEDILTFPEGGTRAWLVVLGVWLMQFCTFGYTNAYGVYNDFYVRDYMAEKYTSSQISWIGSVQLFLVLSSGLVSGRAFDVGYFYHLMIGGSLLLVFCLFMLSITQPEQYYQVFLTQGLGMGIAVGMTYIPGLGVVSHYFQRRRALAIGVATTGTAVGGALHPIMLNKWFHGSLGFHNGVRASAGLNAGLLIISILLMKPRLPPSIKAHSTLRSLRVFLQDIPYVVMVLGTVLVLAGLYFPIFFLQLNSIKNGIDADLAFYTIAILNGASFLGRVLPNMLVYRFGAFNVVIPCITISAALIFCTLAVKDVAGTMVFAICYGFFSGAYVSLLAPMIGSLAKNDSEIGARLGICFTFTGLGGLIGSPIAGALLSTTFKFWKPILFAGLSVSCGTVCFCITRYMRSRKLGTQWL
ncbi:major facilitator superfamily domain-containing protein [Crucibulum laeve]|uniref:Major facilitator superfamily domain-containing protein n=1 Tax=Crucibulum laeve TaxID=68775 RepID=A0A5C3LHD0_9AGAR|nr:major facilitator superfamily domain-containing protein [Crucibulum laeve]